MKHIPLEEMQGRRVVIVANLKPAKALGMTTVWVDNGSERGNHGADDAFIDHRIADVAEWLEDILGNEQ